MRLRDTSATSSYVDGFPSRNESLTLSKFWAFMNLRSHIAGLLRFAWYFGSLMVPVSRIERIQTLLVSWIENWGHLWLSSYLKNLFSAGLTLSSFVYHHLCMGGILFVYGAILSVPGFLNFADLWSLLIWTHLEGIHHLTKILNSGEFWLFSSQ